MSGRYVNELIERVVRERFSSDAVQSVEVSNDVDAEGDTSLKIRVVLNGSFNSADKAKTLGLVRHLRSKLSGFDENSFPIVDFVSSSDAAKLRRETA